MEVNIIVWRAIFNFLECGYQYLSAQFISPIWLEILRCNIILYFSIKVWKLEAASNEEGSRRRRSGKCDAAHSYIQKRGGNLNLDVVGGSPGVRLQ